MILFLNACRILLFLAFYIVSQGNFYPEALARRPPPYDLFSSTGTFRMLPMRPALTWLICWIDRIHCHSWGRSELLTIFKWKLRFWAQGLTSFFDPCLYHKKRRKRSIRQRNVKIISLDLELISLQSSFLVKCQPSRHKSKGSGVLKPSYSCGISKVI